MLPMDWPLSLGRNSHPFAIASVSLLHFVCNFGGISFAHAEISSCGKRRRIWPGFELNQ
jgi:hypothetical protein